MCERETRCSVTHAVGHRVHCCEVWSPSRSLPSRWTPRRRTWRRRSRHDPHDVGRSQADLSSPHSVDDCYLPHQAAGTDELTLDHTQTHNHWYSASVRTAYVTWRRSFSGRPIIWAFRRRPLPLTPGCNSKHADSKINTHQLSVLLNKLLKRWVLRGYGLLTDMGYQTVPDDGPELQCGKLRFTGY